MSFSPAAADIHAHPVSPSMEIAMSEIGDVALVGRQRSGPKDEEMTRPLSQGDREGFDSLPVASEVRSKWKICAIMIALAVRGIHQR